MDQLTKYRRLALKKAEIIDLGDDEGFAARIPGFKGLLASAATRKAVLLELDSALEDWVNLALVRGIGLPTVSSARQLQFVTA